MLPLLGRVLGTNRSSALALLGIGGLVAMLVVIGALVLGWIAPRRKFGRDRDLARWVGSRHAPIASDLLSAVELANAPPRPGAPSPELVDALVETTTSELDTIEPGTLLPARELRKARTYALAAALLNVALLAIVPGVMFAGWRRLVLSPPSPYDGAQLSAL